MKKNIVIAILSVMVIALVGVIICMSLKNEEENKVSNKNKQNQTNEEVPNQKKREYIHYTSTELKFDKNREDGIGIKVEVKDEKLVETSNKGLTFSGIEGKVKYFTYDIDCGGMIGFLVLTEDNKVYTASYDYAGTYGESDKNIVFKAIATNERIKDITEYINPEPTSCDGIYLGVVLENGKVYSINQDRNGNYSLGTKDYSIYKGRFIWMFVYADDTVSLVTEDAEKIKYNNENLLVKKIYTSSGMGDKDDYYYILDKEDKLYKIEIGAKNGDGYQLFIQKVSPVKDSQASSIEENKDNIKVTFKDGTSETLKANISGYGVYKNLE